MISKALMLALSAFSFYRGNAALSANSLELVKKTIRKEVLEMAFKILFGAVLVAGIIFSIFQFGDATKILIEQMENAIILKIVVFGLSALVGSLLLYFLLAPSSRTFFTAKAPEPSKGVDLQALMLQFAQGFVDGMNTQNTKKSSDPSESSQENSK